MAMLEEKNIKRISDRKHAIHSVCQSDGNWKAQAKQIRSETKLNG
jgi:ribosomal protein L32